LGTLDSVAGTVYGLNNYILQTFWIGTITIFVIFNRNFFSDLKHVEQTEINQKVGLLKRIFRIGLFGFFVAIIAFLVLSSVIIMPSKTGQVLDSNTNEPLEGISLIRRTNVHILCFGCDGERTVRTEISTTDKDGRYKFRAFIKIKSPLDSFYRELLYVNVDGNLQQPNVAYEGEIIGVGFHGLWGALFGSDANYGPEFEPFNNEISIRLKPI
jgi:hypothetical protein